MKSKLQNERTDGLCVHFLRAEAASIAHTHTHLETFIYVVHLAELAPEDQLTQWSPDSCCKRALALLLGLLYNMGL